MKREFFYIHNLMAGRVDKALFHVVCCDWQQLNVASVTGWRYYARR